MTRTDTPTGWVRRLVAVILAMTATTAALAGAPAPAGAAACSTSSGVSVVVDFTGATGGIQSVCVAGGAGQSADQVIASAGFGLTWVTRQPGFICRVNDFPADDPCVNTPPPTAYWGLFWSDGKDGAWHYSDIGSGGLQVPDGGYIGLAWQTGTRREPGQEAIAHPVVTPTATPTPTTAPTTSTPSPTGTSKPTKNPTSKPTSKPTRQPTPTPTSTGTSSATTSPTSPTETSSTTDPSASATTVPPSESPSESPSSSGIDSPSTSATVEPSASAAESSTATPSDAATQGESRTEEGSSRVPTWLTLTILGSLLVAIGMSTYAARRRTRH